MYRLARSWSWLGNGGVEASVRWVRLLARWITLVYEGAHSVQPELHSLRRMTTWCDRENRVARDWNAGVSLLPIALVSRSYGTGSLATTQLQVAAAGSRLASHSCEGEYDISAEVVAK